MKTVEYKEMLGFVQSYSANGTPWHHHFFPVDCAFSQDGKFQIVLENKTTEESFVCYFEEKPMKELEQLEIFFFKRKS